MNAYLSAPKSKKLLTLFSLYIGFVGSILVSATQSTMLPIAALEIGGADYYSLVATLSGVVGIVCLPLYGYIAAKNPAIKGKLMGVSLLINAVVFFSRTLVTSMWQIIIPGMLYGLIPPTIYVVGYSIVRDIYDAKKAAYYLGFSATMVSIGQLVGPTVGGMIMDAGSWRVVNHLIWPLMLVAGLFALLGVHVKKEDVMDLARNVRFDYWGAISLALFLGCLNLALSIGTSFAKFGTLPSNLLFITAAVALVSFIVSIRKMGTEAFLPLGVLKDRNTLCFTAANMFVNLHTMATIFFLPMFILYVLQESATMSGLATSLYAVAGLFMGPIYGRIIGKSGNAKPVFLFGTGLRIVLTAIYVLILKEGTSIYLILFIQLISGFYNSQSSVTFSVGPQVMLDEKIRVQGNSVIQTFQTVGSTLAVALYTMVIGMFGVMPGIRIAFAIALVFAIIAFIAGLPLKKLPTEETTAAVEPQKSNA